MEYSITTNHFKRRPFHISPGTSCTVVPPEAWHTVYLCGENRAFNTSEYIKRDYKESARYMMPNSACRIDSAEMSHGNQLSYMLLQEAAYTHTHRAAN